MTSPDQLQARLDWSDTESAKPQHVNQLLAQIGPPGTSGLPDGIYMTLGVAPPPALMPDDSRLPELLENIRRVGIKVNVLGQYHISRQLLDDIIRVLQITAEKYDEALRQVAQEKESEPA